MSEEQKIWFIYITDHHEGPFTISEIKEKVTQGLANKQDRKSTRLNSSHSDRSRMPSSA